MATIGDFIHTKTMFHMKHCFFFLYISLIFLTHTSYIVSHVTIVNILCLKNNYNINRCNFSHETIIILY